MALAPPTGSAPGEAQADLGGGWGGDATSSGRDPRIPPQTVTRRRHTGSGTGSRGVRCVAAGTEAATWRFDPTHRRGTGAYLWDANLAGADLRGANLFMANLMRTNLTGARLDGAYLRGADFWGANLSGARFDGAVGRADQG